MSGKVGRPLSTSLTRRKPFLDEYLSSVSWKDLLKKFAEQRPLIFILMKGTSVDEVAILEASELLHIDKLGKVDAREMLTQKVVNGLSNKPVEEIEAIMQDELPPDEPEPPVIIPTKAPTSSVEIVKEAISEVAKTQGNEGEVSVGRWVEFTAPDNSMKQGRVTFITPDESSFLLTTKDGQSILVKAEKLISLIPEVV